MGLLKTLLILAFLFQGITASAQTEENSDTDVEQANAQEDSAAEATEDADQEASPSRSGVEKLQVTGSYIRRTDVEGPSPVVTIDRATIEASGFNNVGSLLRADTSSPFGGDGERVSLRGLGTDRTLVLIDGQRAPRNASSYNAQGADVNMVPLAAVERIEILKDGASAIYGSEAIGGVVNIITRRNLDGIVLSTKYDMSEPNGGDLLRTSVAYASNSSRSTFLASMQHVYRQGSKINDLSYRRGTLDRSTWSPNFKNTSTDSKLKAAPNCPTSRINAAGECTSDLGELFGDKDSHELGGIVSYTYDIDSDTELYSTFIGRYNQDNGFSAGTNIGIPGSTNGIPFNGTDAAAISGTPVVAGLAPGDYTPGDDITIFGRLPNTLTDRAEEYMAGLIVGAKGYYGDGDWTWDASLNNQFFVDHRRNQGIGMFKETKAALLDGTYNQFTNAAQNINGLTYDAVARDRYQVNWANFISTGGLGDAMGAAWSAAVGVSAAHFEYSEDSDDRAVNKTLMGLVGADAKGERQLYAGYAEVSGIFANNFEAQLALRFDQYSDFGNTLNPKFAMRYQPIKSLTFRTSVGTGFNAPSLQQAYGPNLEFFLNQVIDPVGCDAVGNDATNENCKPLSITGQRATNTNLKEETSINFNFGMVAEPIKYLTISLDYWRVKVENVILSGDYNKLLELEQQGVDISKYNATTIRDATANQRLTRITLGLANAGTREVDGLDANVEYLLKTSIGDFNFVETMSYLFSYTEAFYDEFGTEQVLGQGGTPRWRNVATLGYSKGWFRTQFIARTTSDVERQSRNLARLPQFTQYDLNFDFSVGNASRLSVGAINVFDQRPKLDPSQGGLIETDLYRPVRVVYMGYRTEF